MRKRIGLMSILVSFSLSVCCMAAPVDFTQYDYMLPQLITSNGSDPLDTAVTEEDFVVAMPYKMVVETIEKVPLAKTRIQSIAIDFHFDNLAVKQNQNFERTQSI
ncbi:MAG: hypothetical protein JKY62_16710 [Desulfocapsa sp.]|nr:hypothetical protein [Desulfocapsa sp.]